MEMIQKHESLSDFADMMHDMEEFKQVCITNNKPLLADKWQKIIEAFNLFTEADIIEMEKFMN